MKKESPLIIADTYKIIGEIGSGGGGIVYLAEHLRLHKKVVLKADKRKITANEQVLRREVDALKDLSHTYIPQVYDFIVENEIVYTVMDYIEGESFDKPLKRGEKFSQANVIEWACQLLEAIDYLHSRPPHGILHADIKPANIMLTSQGTIRLIDFNIALALGEEGAVAVGRSFGYASPEHYGVVYQQNTMTIEEDSDATVLQNDEHSYINTVIGSVIEKSYSATSGKKILLDVRSDIYSLGATLYHILSGIRPSQVASEVMPLSRKEFSPKLIEIIEKAMNPDSTLRFNTAKEFLFELIHLREKDPRVIRYKRVRNATICALISIFVIGGGLTFAGLKQEEQYQREQAEIQRIEAEKQKIEARTQELFVFAAESTEKLRSGDKIGAIESALNAIPSEHESEIDISSQAIKALTDALNIYNISDGFKQQGIVELPSAPLFLQVSPNGKTAAIIYAFELAIIDTENNQIIKTLPVENSALSEVKYIDDNMIVFASVDGVKVYDISTDTELWTGEKGTIVAVSEDKEKIATVYKDDSKAIVYNSSNGDIVNEIDFEGKYQRVTVNDVFANPNDNLLALNNDGTMLAVSFDDGSLWVYNLQDRDGDIQIFDESSEYFHFNGGFYEEYLAFAATNSEKSTFAVVDVENLIQTGGFSSSFPFRVLIDKKGINLQTENILVNINPTTGEQTPLVAIFDEINEFDTSGDYTIVSADEEYMFFDGYANLMQSYQKEFDSKFVKIANDTAIIGSSDSPSIHILKLETHSDKDIMYYDGAYKHSEARISSDYKTVMTFSYDEFKIFDKDGSLINTVEIPEENEVYDQQYIRDESSSRLEVIYNNGYIRAYSAIDGSILYEKQGEVPDLTLYEEYFTEKFRVEAELHGVPKVYDINTGEVVTELNEDAYLTYVTQMDEYIITEYITTDGKRYGLLLNDKWEELAYLPNLCDIIDGKLIFDDNMGVLRESRIYSIQELILLARN